jgi:serine/threonine-protein kinase RsbW
MRSRAKQTCAHGASVFKPSASYEVRELGGSQPSTVTYTLESSLDSVNRVEQTAEEMARKAGLEDDEVFRVAMAVREAAVNAVLHGNAYDPDKRMTASFEQTAESLVIRIADQGKGLNPDSLPDPLAPENLLRGSGRGIFLIRSFMDEVHFRQLQPGTELTLIKHLGTARSAI